MHFFLLGEILTLVAICHLRRLLDVRRSLSLRPPLAQPRRHVHQTASQHTHVSLQQDQKATERKPTVASQHPISLSNDTTALSLGPQLLYPSRGKRFASWYNSHGPLQSQGQAPTQTPKHATSNPAVTASAIAASHNTFSYGRTQQLTRPFSHANRIFMPEEEFREGKAKALRGHYGDPFTGW
ncbi:glutaminase kidney isoform [Tropilaelaps mercedesae]|uniref:Glutaminase kidney isoform n=1 Tax=Tropilaelaps mercedesae TaxID=418985 RepID=A0A1V9XQN6_9ACAR|nr:glutaminase kidney isoform [Tropilaelaps mercedesae]